MSRDYDVLLAGGGPAGFGAAVAAARNGASTLLIEMSNALGGMLVNGLVLGMIRTAGDRGGIVMEFWRRLDAAGGAEIGPTHVWVDPFAARVVMLDMLDEAGADLLLHTRFVSALKSGQSVTGARIANKDGLQEVGCGLLIDATGDGDAAASAGAPFEKGDPEDGRLQAVSLNFLMAGVNEDALPDRDEFGAACAEALDSGLVELPPPARTLSVGYERPALPKGIRQFQFDLAYNVDASDAGGLSDGERFCHRRVFAIWRFLKSRFEAFRDSHVVSVASHMGVRETRRILGEATLTEEMVLGAVKHPDGVSRAAWYMDLHDGQDKRPIEQYRAARRPPEGDYYEIPYGCLVPRDVDGLLVCGRCISSTRPANGSLRLQATCMNLGQAAGVAASLCLDEGVAPRALDGARVRERLIAQGANL